MVLEHGLSQRDRIGAVHGKSVFARGTASAPRRTQVRIDWCSLLGHECVVVQSTKQAAISGPAECDLRHPRPFRRNVRGSDTNVREGLAHGLGKHIA